MLKLAYNTTDSVIVVDEAGYSIGGHEWGVVETTDAIGRAEIGAGRLIEVDEDAAREGNPLASQALQTLEVRRAREEAAKKMDKSALAAQVDPAVLETMETGGDGLPAKSELVDVVTADPEAVVDEPKKSTSSRTAAKK